MSTFLMQVSEFDGLRKENVTLRDDNKKLRSELKGHLHTIQEVSVGATTV